MRILRKRLSRVSWKPQSVGLSCCIFLKKYMYIYNQRNNENKKKEKSYTKRPTSNLGKFTKSFYQITFEVSICLIGRQNFGKNVKNIQKRIKSPKKPLVCRSCENIRLCRQSSKLFSYCKANEWGYYVSNEMRKVFKNYEK